MFTLRRILPNGVENNLLLGDNYAILTRERNADEFNNILKDLNIQDQPEIYGVLTYNEGKDTLALWKDSGYYIMSDTGKTFANLTLK